jgi:hypothetical protein
MGAYFDQLLKLLNPVVVPAVIAAFVALLVSRRTNYVNTVTAQRSIWIENLRKNIAQYSSLVFAMNEIFRTGNMVEIQQSTRYQDLLKQMRELRPLLRLQLNPFGKIDNNIIAIIERIPTLTESDLTVTLMRADNLLIAHAQWLLKAEWEKVKLEASGVLYRPWAWVKAWRHACGYRRFCKGDGSLVGILSS